MAAAARKPVAPAALAAAEQSSPRTGCKVTVAYKGPSGLLLRLFKMVDYEEPILGGGMRTRQRAQQIGEMVRINGVAAPTGVSPNCAVVGGYALTPNVDADFFERWLEQNKDHDAVVKEMIFSQKSPEDAGAQAKELRKTRSGLEPINTDPAAKDPRMVKGVETVKKTEDE